MNFTLAVLLISLSIFANRIYAESSVDFFDSKDSSRYNLDQKPTDNKHNNRFDNQPIITIKSFDLSSFPDLNEYEIDQADLQKICSDSLKDNNNRYTIDRLNQLTNALTNHLRKKGLVLARAYIPEQNIANETVRISVIEGIIQTINSTQLIKTKNSTELYHNDTLIRPFRGLIDKASFRPELESSMIRLSQYPGLKTQTQFQPGSESGKTILNIKVIDQKKFEGYLTFDNFGSEYTGAYRVLASGKVNNITGNADQLTLGFMATLDPTNSYFGSFDYTLPLESHIASDSFFSFINPIFHHGLLLQLGVQQNSYAIGQELEALNIKGEATTIYYSLKKPWLRNNSVQFDSSLKLDLKKAVSKQNGNILAEDKLTVFNLNNTLKFSDHFYDTASNTITLNLHKGLESTLGSMSNDDSNSRINQNLEYAPPDFTKFTFGFSRLQQIDSFQVLAKLNYQHSDDALLALEQVALGGPYAVRGYTSADYTADSAFQTTIELIGKSYAEKLSLPIDHLTAAVFVDYAIGWRNDALANETDSSHLFAVGWYAEFVKQEKFQTRLQMGFPLSDTDPVNGNSIQFYLSAQRRF
jgi:hemolysin activation/secretion protein